MGTQEGGLLSCLSVGRPALPPLSWANSLAFLQAWLICIALAALGCEFAWGAILWVREVEVQELFEQDFSLLLGKQGAGIPQEGWASPVSGLLSSHQLCHPVKPRKSSRHTLLPLRKLATTSGHSTYEGPGILEALLNIQTSEQTKWLPV